MPDAHLKDHLGDISGANLKDNFDANFIDIKITDLDLAANGLV